MRNKHRQHERGQSLVETAIILPILIILLGGVVDIGRAFIFLVGVENAAGEGALYAAVNPACLTDDHADDICQNDESVTGRIIQEGEPFVTLTADMITITVDDGVGGSEITAGSTVYVDVEFSYNPLTPLGFLLWGSTATIQATADQILLSPPPPGYQY